MTSHLESLNFVSAFEIDSRTWKLFQAKRRVGRREQAANRACDYAAAARWYAAMRRLNTALGYPTH